MSFETVGGPVGISRRSQQRCTYAAMYPEKDSRKELSCAIPSRSKTPKRWYGLDLGVLKQRLEPMHKLSCENNN